MKTSVTLQDPFHYMIIWLIIAVIFIGLVVFSQIYFRKKLGDRLKRQKQIKLKKIAAETLEGKKRKYMNTLMFIESDLRAGKITVREAYQRMSICIRMFVSEVTGIKVHKYTLTEIRRVNIPQLTQIVKEYYEPEFALDSKSDVMSSISRTRSIIGNWRR